MFCQLCGKKLVQNLSYCPQCGNSLQRKTDDLKKQKDDLNGLLIAISLGGLGIIIGLAVVLKEVLNLDTQLIVLFVAIGFLAVLAVEIMFIWQLVRLQRREASFENENSRLPAAETKMLEEANTPMLYPTPASVTEGTTEVLQPAAEELKTKRL